ncbi:MAG: hypothetical protein AAGH89_04695 [Verrucomicrobiota bacterium]
MKATRIVSNNLIGILGLTAAAILSFLTPWTEPGSVAKLIFFPFVIGAISCVLLSFGNVFRLLLALAVVLGIGFFSALHSNGYHWRMDHEWGLVITGLGIHAFFALVGFSVSRFGPKAWRKLPEPLKQG